MQRVRTLVLGVILCLPVAGYGARLYEPVEWRFNNPSFNGNPYQLVSTATFVHASADDIVTELFYDGGNTWTLRFTGTAVGQWSFRTSSLDPELDGLTGTVVVTDNPGSPGFITKVGPGGNKWGRTGSNQAFVPQLTMFPVTNVYHQDPAVSDDALETYLGDHGFNGLHTSVFNRWFDINQPRYENISANPNPDRRTFEALENLILKTYAAGGVVHIWAWGDEQQHLTPIKWGINGAVDRRLQRYIAARLGPLPGWTMGYGFDLDEWVSSSQLRVWRDYMHAHLGWSHILGGRPAGPNSGTNHSAFIDWNQRLDYSSYEHHRPTYEVYVAALENVPGQPVMSEDRFRVRPVQRTKDYTLEDTRRGLWNSTMAGGVANIWGYTTPIRADGGSNPYPNAKELLTNGRFWKNRFRKNFVRANGLTDGRALRSSNSFYVFYRERASTIFMDLSGMDGPHEAVAVDAKKPYEELPLGTLTPGSHQFEAPYRSDWAVAVGGPAPGVSVQSDLGLVDLESGLYRVTVSDGDTRATNIGGQDSRRNDTPSDAYMYFNVVGSYAFEGDRREVEITIEYYDAGTARLRLQYDSLSARYQSHTDIVQLTNTNTWKQKTWSVSNAFFGNRQNQGADFRINRMGGGLFYLKVVQVSVPAMVLPGPATNPTPVNGSINVGVETDLEWSPGAGATSNDIYFGDRNPPLFQGNLSSTRFDPGPLAANTTYFWRVDTVNAAGTMPGALWSFTTGDAALVPTLNFKQAGPIVIDGAINDWVLSEFTSPALAGEAVAGDIAITGFDGGMLYFAGRATHLALPTNASDHTARVYGRHSATHLYFLVRVDDSDIRTPRGVVSNWANDCVEIYIDPSGNGGPTRLTGSTSDIQLIIDAANQQNVYVTTDAYKATILSGVRSAVRVDGTGWWLEVEIDKSVLAPSVPVDGSFGVDFNFRDNDNLNDTSRTTVYTWSDFERSNRFPSKIPDRWGTATIPPVMLPPLPGPASQPSPAHGARDVSLGADLIWTAGIQALSHDVYFDTNNPPVFQGNQTDTRFDPGSLMVDTTYYWRINEVNGAGTTPGPIWSFTTALDAPIAALHIKAASAIAIDGSASDWNLSEFTTVVRGGDRVAGDIALVGYHLGTLYYGGRATKVSLPTSASDHTARVYSRHDGTYLYFLVQVNDDDLQAPHGAGANWANDSVEFYIDPSGNGGTSPLANSTSDIQLVIDVVNQQNVYKTTSAYRTQILSGVRSAVSVVATGWQLEVRIEKSMLDPNLGNEGVFGLDFNFRDNDANNDPSLTTVYSWSDTEQSGVFPSKIPNRWGDGLLAPVSPNVSSQIGLNVHIPSNGILNDVGVNLGVRWLRVDFDWYRIEPNKVTSVGQTPTVSSRVRSSWASTFWACLPTHLLGRHRCPPTRVSAILLPSPIGPTSSVKSLPATGVGFAIGSSGTSLTSINSFPAR